MNLFDSIKPNIKIVRLTPEDAKKDSDHLGIFRDLILDNEDMYPGIDKWYSKKVVPGIASTDRTALVGFNGETPIVSAVVKKGVDTKFCHLKIHDGFRENHLGEVFFILMAMEVRHSAKQIHFTLPSSLWTEQSEFFKSFGFEEAIKAGHQYRLFDEELGCSAPFEAVWNAVLSKLPKLRQDFKIDGKSMSDDLVMSIKPQLADSIMRGNKKVEIRRVFAKKWQGSRVSIYASAPTSALVGSATISRVTESNPEEIWDHYNVDLGCTRDEFFDYVRSTQAVFAIELDDVQPFTAGIPVSQISSLLGTDLKAPQSYLGLEKNPDWASAVSVANLLHGTSESQPHFI